MLSRPPSPPRLLGLALVLVAVLAGVLALTLEQRASSATLWAPAPGTSWQWQLTEPVDLSVRARVYDIDAVDNGASVVARLHALGRHVICYIDVGTYESFRADAHAFPRSVLGAPDRPWPGERWLDIRRLDVLAPIMERRLDVCRKKGFDGVELDNVDAYTNTTGFPLTAADQLRYNRFLAAQAHARRLSAGLKNDLDQIPALVGDFDFAINEECFRFQECGLLRPFVTAHKAVLQVEYSLPPSRFCPAANRLGFSSLRKHLDLDAWRIACRPGPG